MITTGSKVRVDPDSLDYHGGMTGELLSFHEDEGQVQACVKLTAWGTCVMVWASDLLDMAETHQDGVSATEQAA
jgi:hypothetical protein